MLLYHKFHLLHKVKQFRQVEVLLTDLVCCVFCFDFLKSNEFGREVDKEYAGTRRFPAADKD